MREGGKMKALSPFTSFLSLKGGREGDKRNAHPRLFPFLSLKGKGRREGGERKAPPLLFPFLPLDRKRKGETERERDVRGQPPPLLLPSFP